MKMTLNPNTIQKTDFETQINVCNKTGFDYFELMYTVIQQYIHNGNTIRDINNLLIDKNIIPAVVSIESPFWQFETEKTKSEAVDRVKKCSEYCNIFGCDIVTVCSGLKDGSFEQGMEDLTVICEIAKSYGVNICYEPLGFSNKFNDIKSTVELLNKVNYDNCGILLDSFHLYRGNSSLNDIDLIPANKIMMAHICDVIDIPINKMTDLHRVFPGDGILDLNKYLRKLEEKEYNSFISIEIFNEDYWAQNPYAIVEKAKISVENILNNLNSH